MIQLNNYELALVILMIIFMVAIILSIIIYDYIMRNPNWTNWLGITNHKPKFDKEYYCKFDCPFMKIYDSKPYHNKVKCIKDNLDITYYDGYLAHCKETWRYDIESGEYKRSENELHLTNEEIVNKRYKLVTQSYKEK